MCRRIASPDERASTFESRNEANHGASCDLSRPRSCRSGFLLAAYQRAAPVTEREEAIPARRAEQSPPAERREQAARLQILGGANSAGASGAGGARDGGGAGGSAGTGREGGADSSIADGTSGDSGSSGFRPCPTNGDPCKILPLGDSITWGIQYDGAYRVELFNKAVAAGQKITFTGSLSNGPDTVSGMPFPKSNEGHSGWTIAQVTGLVPTPAFDIAPHIVLVMIGTNDIYASSGQSTMPDRLGTLVDKIIGAAPNALLVVAKITPLSNASWNQTIATYNNAIPGVLQTRFAAGKHVMLADMNTGFTPSMLSSDAIHPNKSGYDFMGDVWYAALSNLLPK
jgi:lysophospholipase L1-like esterase